MSVFDVDADFLSLVLSLPTSQILSVPMSMEHHAGFMQQGRVSDEMQRFDSTFEHIDLEKAADVSTDGSDSEYASSGGGGGGENKKFQTIWEYLYTPHGIATFTQWFRVTSVSLDNTFNEDQFLTFMRRLTNMNDFEILIVFDILDVNDLAGVHFQEMFLLFSLLAARETGQLTKFLYIHHKHVFNLLMGEAVTDELDFRAFTSFGYLLGLQPYQILKSLEDFDVLPSSHFTLDNFCIYYYHVLHQVDLTKQFAHNRAAGGDRGFIPTENSGIVHRLLTKHFEDTLLAVAAVAVTIFSFGLMAWSIQHI